MPIGATEQPWDSYGLSKDLVEVNDIHTCASSYQALGSFPKQLRNSLGIGVYLSPRGLLTSTGEGALLKQIYDREPAGGAKGPFPLSFIFQACLSSYKC